MLSSASAPVACAAVPSVQVARLAELRHAVPAPAASRVLPFRGGSYAPVKVAGIEAEREAERAHGQRERRPRPPPGWSRPGSRREEPSRHHQKSARWTRSPSHPKRRAGQLTAGGQVRRRSLVATSAEPLRRVAVRVAHALRGGRGACGRRLDHRLQRAGEGNGLTPATRPRPTSRLQRGGKDAGGEDGGSSA